MEEQNLEDGVTSENTEEESTSTNDESTDDGVEIEQDDTSEKNRQLYARVKKAEAEKKKLEAMLNAKESEKQSVPASGDNKPDVFELAKQVNALKDYSPEELEIIDRQAKVLGLSHVEASKHEDVQTLVSAKREKIKQDNSVPTPSSRQGVETKDVSQYTWQDIAGLDPVKDSALIQKYNDYHRKGRK